MEIYSIGNQEQLRLLCRVSKPIEDINEDIQKLAKTMIETMVQGDGIGLAGPQIGLLQRIFTVKLKDQKPLVFINPEIVSTSSNLSSYEEGCLSIPQHYAEVTRPESLEIQAWNEQGKSYRMEANDLLAVVIQHELDHLNGILFIDHISPNKRKKILEKFGVLVGDYPHSE